MDRFRVEKVEMFDVVDTQSNEIVLNTRDEDEAGRVADSHNEHYKEDE